MLRTILFIYFLSFVHICCQAQDDTEQKFFPKVFSSVKKHSGPAVLVFLSGAADGFNQAINFHYSHVKLKMPGLNDQFWNPAQSWPNKYKNGDPAQGPKFWQSDKSLVFVTDGHHLTRFFDRLFSIGAITFKCFQGKQKWYWYIADAAAYWLINRAGFALVYNHF